MRAKIPFLSFAQSHEIIKLEMQATFQRVYEGNGYIQGQELLQFENEYAQLNQTKYTEGVSNGLDAQISSLRGLNIGVGMKLLYRRIPIFN